MFSPELLCLALTSQVWLRTSRHFILNGLIDLDKFYENPFFLKVLNEYVTPLCHVCSLHGLTNVDYESEVEDDILSIFRKGEEYNYGQEFVLLLTFAKSSSEKNTKDAIDSFSQLTSSLPSLIVESTQGSNFNESSKEFTHAVVVRFRSFDAMEIFIEGREYKRCSVTD